MEVEGKKKSMTANKNANKFCDPCERAGETEVAESYCIDCNEFLCKGCANAHRKSKVSSHHELLERDKMPKKKLVLSSDNTCSRHDGKPLEYFCDNHSNIYCASCVTLEHLNCKLEYFSKRAEGFEDDEDYRALTERIKKVQQRIFGTKDKIKVYRDRAKSNHLNFLAEIQEFRNNIETLVKAVEDNATEKAKDIQDKDVEELDSFSRRSDEMAEEIDKMKEELDLLRAHKQKSRLHFAAKQVESMIDTFENKLADIETKTKVRRYNFRGSEIMKQNLESWGRQEMLEFPDEPTSSDELKENESQYRSDNDDEKEDSYDTTESLPKAETDFDQDSGATASFEQAHRDSTETTEAPDNRSTVHADQTSETKVLERIYIRHIRDTNVSGCFISGMTKLASDRVLVSDYHNYSLKIIDVAQHTIELYVKLTYRPWDTTLLSDERVVVSCCDRLIFLRDRLIKTREVDVKGQCRGIASHEKHIFVTFISPLPCLKIFNMVGVALRTISNKQRTDIFISPKFVILWQNGEEIVVSDGVRGLLTIKKDGIISPHEKDILQTASGMTQAQAGTIFVADTDNNSVIEISEPSQEGKKEKMQERGQKKMQIILSEIKRPFALVYNKTTERLYVSHDHVSKCNDYLSVFQL